MNAHSVAAFYDFISLTKPRVVALIMLTAVIGALLAQFHHSPVDWQAAILALVGIALVASAAAAFNCLVEIVSDSIMQRTRLRPLPAGRLSHGQAALFVFILGGVGLTLTTKFAGVLVGGLTAATFFGYAVVYTLLLKSLTPQNIVIGGASGAMPPLLGWLVVSGGEVSFEPLLLFLIIFVWTPPHFWALALYRQSDYTRAGIPMLPVTHGAAFTAIQVVLYSIILFVVAMLPYLSGMAGILYLLLALPLNIHFLRLSYRLQRSLAAADGRRLFAYSITYLALLFSALLVDATIAGFGGY